MSPRHSKTVDRWSDAGVTVTFADRGSGETRTVVASGHRKREALRDACSRFDPTVWRIQTISTPQTIYSDLTSARDLRATRFEGHGRGGRLVAHKDVSHLIGGVRHPEQIVAAQAGCGRWL